jgi:hypothetical protein
MKLSNDWQFRAAEPRSMEWAEATNLKMVTVNPTTCIHAGMCTNSNLRITATGCKRPTVNCNQKLKTLGSRLLHQEFENLLNFGLIPYRLSVFKLGHEKNYF